MGKRDYLSVDDLSVDELEDLLAEAAEIKGKPSRYQDLLAGKQIALLFEKPSTRTRVSFEAGINSLGGRALVLRADELQLGGRDHRGHGPSAVSLRRRDRGEDPRAGAPRAPGRGRLGSGR